MDESLNKSQCDQNSTDTKATPYEPLFDCLNVYSSSMFFPLKNRSSNEYNSEGNEKSLTNQNNICGNFKILKNDKTNPEIILLEWHPKPFFLNEKYISKKNISSDSSFSSSDVSLEKITYSKKNNPKTNDEQLIDNDLSGVCNEKVEYNDDCFLNNEIKLPSVNWKRLDTKFSTFGPLRQDHKRRQPTSITPTLTHCASLGDLDTINKHATKSIDIILSEEVNSKLHCNSYQKLTQKKRSSFDNINRGTQRSSSFFTRKRSLRLSPYVYNNNNSHVYHPIYREYSDFITVIKIYVSERNRDCGYLVVSSIEGISKSFNFLRGGIKKLMIVLNTFKWLKRTNSTKKFKNDTRTRKQILYKNVNIPSAEESPQYDMSMLSNFFINKPIDDEIFKTFFNCKGQLVDVYNFKRFGYLYGFDGNVRPDAWKFIFGFYAFSSTYEERTQTEKTLSDEYQILSTLRINEETLPNKSNPYLGIIEKDVVRTDRKNPFYAGDNNPNLAKMKNILLNYSYYRPNIGYSQGMSDLLAPILSLLKQESDSFWCFVGFMETVLSATLPSEDRMDHMMFLVFKLMDQVCPDILNFLRRNDLELSMIFLHRWFILSFQREFPIEQGFRIWEACWFCPILDNGYFQIFVAMAIMLKYHKKTKCKRSIFYHTPDETLNFFTNIIKIANAEAVLKKARKLVARIKQSPTLPCELRVFLYSPFGWNRSILPKIKCNCLNKENCIYKVWTLNNKMEKLITDSIKSFQKQHPRISNQIKRLTK